MNETNVLRARRWEAFVAKLTFSRLLDLWEAALARLQRPAQMRQAARYLEEYLANPPRPQPAVGWVEDDLERPAWVTKSVLDHAHLLAEDFDAAHQCVANEKVLGWSRPDNPQGLVVSVFLGLLGLLSRRSLSALPPNPSQLWQTSLQASTGSWYGYDEEQGSL